MTALASLLDYVSLLPGPTPSVSPTPDRGAGSNTPLWAVILVGLLGGLLGGTGAYLGTRHAARSARQSAGQALEHERTRLLNERFATAAGLLGHDEAACRLAGVHAMAGLADDWSEHRQTCIDVLCAYLRMPYSPRPGATAPAEERLNWQAGREVRHTVIRTIRDHQQATDTPSPASWDGHEYDFTGTVFDGGDFSGTHFTGMVGFKGAEFAGGAVGFNDAEFAGGADFRDARFTGGSVGFQRARFTGGRVSFRNATFADCDVRFTDARFTGARLDFTGARFADGRVSFLGAELTGGTVRFDNAAFTGSTVNFYATKFVGGEVGFVYADFVRGTVLFDHAEFTGSEVDFRNAKFTGGEVDFSNVGSWAVPPAFDNGVLTRPPAGLLPPPPDLLAKPATS
ncbi:pentapeptide repeat-containing protein [Kitasatospora sp. NPDC057904]|uniref:pentapeptide repeat-containing protein n=1 Tax=Kitasatospora sp. NPDC057904 TaxID=3346275 RepID=UPI0036DBE6CE